MRKIWCHVLHTGTLVVVCSMCVVAVGMSLEFRSGGFFVLVSVATGQFIALVAWRICGKGDYAESVGLVIGLATSLVVVGKFLSVTGFHQKEVVEMSQIVTFIAKHAQQIWFVLSVLLATAAIRYI